MTRPLIVNGFMATGKSTVGRRVAELEGVPFEDLDGSIERRAGASVSEIFESAGEAGFRRLERAELERALAEPTRRVIAVGGGALLSRDLRLAALDRACVVCLEAPLEVVLSRAGSAPRPLLAGHDPKPRAAELLEARRAAYAEAHARVDTGRGDVDEAARAVREVWGRQTIAVAAGERSYAVEVGSSIVPERLAAMTAESTGILVVTDGNVSAAQGSTLRAAMPGKEPLVLEPGEDNKTPSALERVWREALARDLDRGSTFVAFGGGVVTDITGFAAATWMRGTRWLAVPTTLLAMVDASVGGKTAVDLEGSKNSVGAFWQPAGVLCDISLLSTEPQRGFVSALSEVVKTALIGDPELLDLLEARSDPVLARDPALVSEIVVRSVAVKARIVSRDERESGLRRVLNLGHTIGHALEACSGYRRYTHGEAVSLGLVAALNVGQRLGVTSRPVSERVIALLERFGLPIELRGSGLEDALAFLGRDKKREGTYIHFVTVSAPGRVETQRLPLEQLRRLAHFT